MSAVYLDYNATAPMRPEAIAAVSAVFARIGNPSSIHSFGRAARATLEDARDRLAGHLSAPRDGLIFTSGGTEAIDLALSSAVAAGARRILVSAVEHDAVAETSRRFVDQGVMRVEIPVDAAGVVDLDALDAALGPEGEGALVCVMAANNETGVIQPLDRVGALVKARGARLLVDAVQAFGKISLEPLAWGADYLIVTAHKLGGPVGIGALAAYCGASVSPRVVGGGQERGLRAGTANVAGAAGFAAAADVAIARLADFARLSDLRDRLEASVLVAQPRARIYGRAAPRLANTACFGLPDFRGETQVMALDLAGVAVSAGSACSSGKMRPSRVLVAMGEEAAASACAIRVSLGWDTEPEHVERFLGVWRAAAARAGFAEALA